MSVEMGLLQWWREEAIRSCLQENNLLTRKKSFKVSENCPKDIQLMKRHLFLKIY
jgi:hypothetical protein